MNNKQLLIDDATNRAVRTLIQNLGIDVLVSIALVLMPIFNDAQDWNDINWGLIGFLLFKTFVVTVFSFAMRRWMDPMTIIPTPLPPNPQPVPHEDTPNA